MARYQLQMLKALDVAKTHFYHFTAIVIAGMSFLTNSYDLFYISLITKLIGCIYYYIPGSTNPGSLPPNVIAAINGVTFCGTLASQLFFEWIRDKMGRKRVYGITLILMVVSAIASRLSSGQTPKGVVAPLCFFRFWLSFGVGVFAMQGFGILAGGIVAIIVSASFKAAYPALAYQVDPVGLTIPQADYVWRIILMVGAIPVALTYYWRMKMLETAPYTTLVARNAKQAVADMATVLNVEMEAEPEKVERLHGNGVLQLSLFQKDIFTNVGWIPSAKTMSAFQETYMVARAQTIIALWGTISGYWFMVAFIDYIGRFVIQLMGFFMMTVFMLGFAVPYNTYWKISSHTAGFIVMYAFTFFFSNFGPNATTFVVPAEIFPARLR
ncbi:hypothetical protein NE237_007437 [Protea cynaroides]|uniref:Major facilitator superfamily (MFS) profile domain-containing protein n=1 Tax=Protea cynaroides TaxID=273540 RepID=A0A9Q0QW82_9MAGN|nr:hypothetical protein NE237_007437 [Protea cynaroides]